MQEGDRERRRDGTGGLQQPNGLKRPQREQVLSEADHHRCHGEDLKADAFILKTVLKPSVWTVNRESGYIVRARLFVILTAVCTRTRVRRTLVPNRDAVRTIRGKAVRLKYQGSIS